MRIPVPTNRLVAFTLAGALLTMAVAAGLAVPGFGPAAESPSDASSPTVDGDAPDPVENFTPDVRTGSEYEEEEYEEEEYEDEEYEDEKDDEYEDEEEEYEEEEYEEEEYGDEEYEDEEYEED